jgi:hypothetical protein
MAAKTASRPGADKKMIGEIDMQSARYGNKDLRFARLHAVKAEQLITGQEIVVKRLRLTGRPLDVENALLGRLYDRKRRVIYHLKRIEDSLDVTSQSEVTP